jgi:hypothetical protein
MREENGRIGKKGHGFMLAAALIVATLLAVNGWADDTRVVTVKKGDTIGSLCRQVYHTYGSEVTALLQQANPELKDLHRIRVGQKLRFPALSVARTATTTPTPVVAPTPVTTPSPAETPPQPMTTTTGQATSPATATGDQMAQVFFHETAPPNSLLPDGTTMAPGFEPAAAPPIGAVEQTQGQAWIIHQGSKLAYTAARDQPLFTGDTLVTDTKAQLRCRLDDRSTFAMAGHSKLVLDKSVYDPDKDRRESVLQLLFGRARFIVNHLKGSYANDYQVRTPTAICGVRGSDFVVAVQPTDTTTARISGWQAMMAKLSELFSVRPAHAARGRSQTTTVLAGENTQLGFNGHTGSAQLVTAGTISKAVTGGAAGGPLGVSGAVMAGAMNSVGAPSAVMAMPAGLE